MAAEISDHLPLIRRVEEIMRSHDFHQTPYDGGETARRLGLNPAGSRRPVIVTAGACALEIGSPKHPTASALLWTRQPLPDGDCIWHCGPDLKTAAPGPVGMAMLILLEIDAETDPTAPNFQAIKNLSNRLPGYMARSIPGKLWIRISHELLNNDFNLASLGQILITAYRKSFPQLANIRVVLAADNPALIDELTAIEKMTAIVTRENHKLTLAADGTLDCTDFSCESCPEKPACDTIREVVAGRRRSDKNE